MQYTVSHNGITCVLPVFTRKIKKRIDDLNDQLCNEEIQLDTKLDSMHSFLVDVAGEENTAKALGSEDMDEIDLNDMNIFYLKIAKEYDRPVEEFNRPEMSSDAKKALQDLDKAAKNMLTIQQATKK